MEEKHRQKRTDKRGGKIRLEKIKMKTQEKGM